MHSGGVLHQATHLPSESGAGAAGTDQQDVRDPVPSRVARRDQAARLPLHEAEEAVQASTARRILIVSHFHTGYCPVNTKLNFVSHRKYFQRAELISDSLFFVRAVYHGRPWI